MGSRIKLKDLLSDCFMAGWEEGLNNDMEMDEAIIASEEIASQYISKVENKYRKSEEVIEKLINLVEHYGNCYNHDLTAQHEYRVAKKYMEDKWTK